jgi:hypothetical protein
VVFPIVLGITRYIWKRAGDTGPQRIPDDTARRIAEMQQSIDAMAVELERISENQRFVTKLLADRDKARPTLERGP